MKINYFEKMKKVEKKDKQMNVALSIKLPQDLRDKVSAKSEETGVSISFVVRKALEDWINEDKTNQLGQN